MQMSKNNKNRREGAGEKETVKNYILGMKTVEKSIFTKTVSLIRIIYDMPNTSS